jgi:hypothetical protein
MRAMVRPLGVALTFALALASLLAEPALAAPGGGAKPDLVVVSLSTSPVIPRLGQAVTFSAVVKNVGNGSTPRNAAVAVAFQIDEAEVARGDVPGPIGAGKSATVVGSPVWMATPGQHSVAAIADDPNTIAEANEANNTLERPLAGTGIFGVNLDPANPAGDPSPQALKAAGARWVRVEWKRAVGYGFYDPRIAAYRAADLKVLLLVDYMSASAAKPASTAPDAAWDTYRAVFQQDVAAIAAHYRDGVDAWEVWNEPDLSNPSGYDPGMPARQFGLLLRDAVAAIRAADPVEPPPIVSGGVKTADTTYLRQAREAAGGSLHVDAVGVHPYERRAPDGWPAPTWGTGEMSAYFDAYLSAFGLPLWVTEIGTNDQGRQAQYLENVYALAGGRYAGRVPEVFWFCWSDGMVHPFGLLDASGTPKPAYQRYQAIAGSW